MTVEAKQYDLVMPMFSGTGRFEPRALATIQRSFMELHLVDKEPDLTKLAVAAVDVHTVKISLKAPTPYLLGLLAHTSSQIVNKAAVEIPDVHSILQTAGASCGQPATAIVLFLRETKATSPPWQKQ